MKRSVALVVIGGATAAVLACGPYSMDTVHFGDVADFGLPPAPLVIGFWEEYSPRPVPGGRERLFGDFEAQVTESQKRADTALAAQRSALAAEARAQAESAVRHWNQVVLNASTDPYSESKTVSTEHARFRADLWQENLSADVRKSLLDLSLRLDKGGEGETDAISKLTEMASDSFKGAGMAYARYALASRQYESGEFAAASKLYEEAAIVPSRRREAALVMAIRTALHPSLPLPDLDRTEALMGRFATEFPKSRFAANLAGYRVRVKLLKGQKVEALKDYLRQLSVERTPAGQEGVLSSIRIVMEKLTPEEAKQVREAILGAPELLEPYLDFRLYHTDPSAAERRTLATFAADVLARNPNAKLNGEIRARLAEIEYTRGNYALANQHATESLATDANRRADLATYVLAGVAARKGDKEAVAKRLENYEARFKDSYLAKPALEMRALNAERQGRWSDALADYDQLGYRTDVAYILDVRLTPAMVERLASAKGTPRLRLAAGYRQLRVRNYPAAIQWFSSIPAKERKAIAGAGSRDYAWLQPREGSPLDLIPDPLTTAKDLQRLSAAKDAAGQYRYLSYFYERRNLLLYNADLWQGLRGQMGFGWNDKIASPEDRAARRLHHTEHECLWHARQLAIALAKKHPKSPEAPKALYRAATATRRLASFNPYWRNERGGNDLYKEAADLLKRVYVEYPRSPLARNAKKYEGVFRSEGRSALNARLFDKVED